MRTKKELEQLEVVRQLMIQIMNRAGSASKKWLVSQFDEAISVIGVIAADTLDIDFRREAEEKLEQLTRARELVIAE
jgi:hypothetical protein